MRRNVTARRAIDRFIEYHRRPFKAVDVANDTGIHPKTVRNMLPQFVREGRIRVMLREPGGNIYGKVPKIAKPCPQKQYDWKPTEAKLRRVYNMVGKSGFPKIIARKLRLSTETTARYLRILRIEGCITRETAQDAYVQIVFHPVIRWFSEYLEIEKEQQRVRQEEAVALKEREERNKKKKRNDWKPADFLVFWV